MSISGRPGMTGAASPQPTGSLKNVQPTGFDIEQDFLDAVEQAVIAGCDCLRVLRILQLIALK